MRVPRSDALAAAAISAAVFLPAAMCEKKSSRTEAFSTRPGAKEKYIC
jgi:hypothetical protein